MANLKQIEDLLSALDDLACRPPNLREAPDFKKRLEGKLRALMGYVSAHDLAYEMRDLMKAIPKFPLSGEGLSGFLEVLHAFIVPEARRRFGAHIGADGSRWEHLHPRVVHAAQRRLEAGHLADAVEAALKEVNSTVKALVLERTGQELDGARLMTRAFSVEKPILQLGDLSSESGRSEQTGFMQIFAGSIIGIRNPAAHANVVLDECMAVHFLYLASLLMFKLDPFVTELEPAQNPPQHRTADAAGEGE